MDDDNTTTIDDTEYARHIIFILLLIVEIPSIMCTLLILAFFFSHWYSMMTKALHHHTIFLLIIVSFFYITLDLPFSIIYYRLGYDYIRTIPFCLWWYWIDYTLLSMSLFLTATASVQRHILIFYAHWLRIKRIRWLLHFIPLILCVLYPALFYTAFIFLYPCEILYDEESPTCSYPCYSDDIILNNVDWIVNYISPLIIIVLANIALICRVIYSMKRIRQRGSHIWKKQRKLTMQLLSFSLLYILGWAPSTFVTIIQMYFLPNLFDDNPNLYYINNSVFFICPLQSFICVFALPPLIQCIKTWLMHIFSRSTVRPFV